MKSKTSFFNISGPLFSRTLFLKNLSRYWPLWGLASFFGGLFPLSGIMTYIRHPDQISPATFSGWYYDIAAYGAPVVMLLYCLLAAMAVWSWLYNPRNVGMMHTLPIRREGLFVTSFLSGMAMTAIPCAVMCVLTVIMSLVAHAFQLGPLLVTILIVAAIGFFYFATATAAAFLTGNVFAFPALYFLFHFLAPMVDYGVSIFGSNLIFGLQSNYYSGTVNFLSPTVYLMEHVMCVREYEEETVMESGGSYTRSVVTAVHLQGGWIVAAYALVGVLLLVVAWALYRYRRSECAGDVIAMRWGKPVFQAGITGLAALGGGQLLYLVLFFNLLDNSNGRYALFPLIVCMTVAGLIGYYAAAMLLAKTLRVFKGSLPGAAATLAFCTALCSVMYFDAFHIAARVPEDDEILYVGLSVAGNNYMLYPAGAVLLDGGTEDDTELLEDLRSLHRTILAHENEIRSFSYNDYWRQDIQTDYEHLTINYHLKNGLHVERNYNLNLVETNMDNPDSWEYALDRFVNSPILRNKRLHAGDPRYTPNGGDLYVEREEVSFSLSSREAELILAALSEDAKEGTWGTYSWFDDYGERYAMDLNLSFEYKLPNTGDDGRRWDYIQIIIRPGMRHTVQALKELGYATDRDFVTYNELDRIRTGEVDEASNDEAFEPAKVRTAEVEEYRMDTEGEVENSSTLSTSVPSS